MHGPTAHSHDACCSAHRAQAVCDSGRSGWCPASTFHPGCLLGFAQTVRMDACSTPVRCRRPWLARTAVGRKAGGRDQSVPARGLWWDNGTRPRASPPPWRAADAQMASRLTGPQAASAPKNSVARAPGRDRLLRIVAKLSAPAARKGRHAGTPAAGAVQEAAPARAVAFRPPGARRLGTASNPIVLADEASQVALTPASEGGQGLGGEPPPGDSWAALRTPRKSSRPGRWQAPSAAAESPSGSESEERAGSPPLAGQHGTTPPPSPTFQRPRGKVRRHWVA